MMAKKAKPLPMTSVIHTRGFFLPYTTTPAALNRRTLVVGSKFVQTTIFPVKRQQLVLDPVSRRLVAAPDVQNPVTGEMEPAMVDVQKPNQLTASILEAIMLCKHAINRMPDGALGILFSPLRVVTTLSTRDRSTGGEERYKPARHVGNYSWLLDQLIDMSYLRAMVMDLQSGATRHVSAIIREIAHPALSDPSDLLHCVNPRGKTFRRMPGGRAPKEKHADPTRMTELVQREAYFWGIVFDPTFAHFYLRDVGVDYPSLLPILNSMSAEGQALARYSLGQNYVVRGDPIEILRQLGRDLTDRRRALEVRNALRHDTQYLAKCGVELVERGHGGLEVNYNKEDFDPAGAVVRFSRFSER